jgi:hypothetical protein
MARIWTSAPNAHRGTAAHRSAAGWGLSALRGPPGPGQVGDQVPGGLVRQGERSHLEGNPHPAGRKSVLANAQNRTTLHQYSQIPGSGDFLPKFLPKQAPL